MLLYITAEDVFGTGTPRRRGPRPLHSIPATVPGLFDLGLRHHVRAAAMLWPKDGGFEAVPDWKLDRLAIRLALFGRERLGVEPGERVAIFGRLGWLWPVADFGAMGFGAVPVGLEHDLGDDALLAALAQARPCVVYASDPDSGERLRRLRERGRLGAPTLVFEAAPERDGILPLARVLELGGTLDTPERAQSFRAVSRHVEARGEALWHVSAAGIARLTQGEAMARLTPGLRHRPGREGDVAYVEGPRASLASRLACAAFVGDGLSTTALGTGARTAEDVANLQPHRLLVPADWLEKACDGRGPRWLGALDRP